MPLPSHLRFISASTNRQHPLKTAAGMVNADHVEESPSFLGICDGVSEVQSLGISPDELPKELLLRIREALEEREAKLADTTMECSQPIYPCPSNGSWLIDAVKDAYLKTDMEGSTTLLMAVIEETNRLLTLNVGDCCLLVVRREPAQPQKFTIAFKTEPLRFDHNKPLQIARLEGIGEHQILSVINSANVSSFQALHGDMLVIGSDGVFDNLHDEDILRIMTNKCPWTPPRARQQPVWGSALLNLMPVPSISQLGGAAAAIVQGALDSVCVSKVDESTGQIKWPPGARQTPSGLGGKPDDTTVIVAAIVEVTDPAAHEDFFYKVHPSAVRRDPSFRNPFDTGCCGGHNASVSDGCRCS